MHTLRKLSLLETSGMEAAGLLNFLGGDGSTLLFCCIMDDFMTQQFDVAGGNVVDIYLKRRGWKETARSRAYLKAVRWSVMSLYEPEFWISDLIIEPRSF